MTPPSPSAENKESIVSNSVNTVAGRNAVRIHGAPGERARFAGVIRALWPLLGAVFMIGVLIGAILPRATSFFGGLPLAIAALIALCAAFGPGRRRIGAFFNGARGEELVGAELSRLPGGYDIFHGVNLGSTDTEMRRSSDIDHVVIGPNGACVIETKTWNGSVTIDRGRILVNGVVPSRSPVAQARNAANQLSAWLKAKGIDDIPVRSIVCFAGTGGSMLDCAIDEIEVCPLPRLLQVVTRDVDGAVAPSAESLASAVEMLSPLVDM